MKDEYVNYVVEHPELKQIMSDFLSKILLDKPKDIPSYASSYFAGFLPKEAKDSVRECFVMDVRLCVSKVDVDLWILKP